MGRHSVPNAAVVAVVVLAAPAGAQVPAPLERHRPVLVYDSRERHFAVPVEALTSVSELEREDGPPVRAPAAAFLGRRYADGRAASGEDVLAPLSAARPGPPVVYGRDTRDRDGRRWLQYWLFFAENPQDRGIVRTGRHTGDWEVFQVRLDGNGRPVETTFSQHTWAEGCGWRELERDGAAPLVYVSNGSHALYPRAGTADRPFPDPNDEADGRGRRVRPALRTIGERSPRWVAWPGRWGAARAGFVPGEQPSPRGPAFQAERWDDPGGFHAAQARPCGSGPPGRWWQTALLAVLGVALVVALLRVARRSYNRGP